MTRLVVGECISIPLGIRVGSSGDEGLQLQNGKWVAIGAAAKFVERLRRRVEAEPSNVVQIGPATARAPSAASPKRWRPTPITGRWSLDALALVTVLGAGGLYWTATKMKNPTAPKAAATAPAMPITAPQGSAGTTPQTVVPTAVQIVAAPYEPNGPALPMAAPVAGSASQSPVPDSVLQSPAKNPAAEAGGARPPTKGLPNDPPAMRAADAKVPDAKGADKPRPPAVLLDDAPAAKPPPPAAGQPTAAQSAAGPSRPDKAPPVATAPAPSSVVAKAPALPRGTGLVAITPDAKSAVFTNPKTRLPEQFKVGDQLPSGETLKAIDGKDGKVVTSAKEYHLD